MSTLKQSPTQQRKDAAYITGGTTGLKLSDEIIGVNSIKIWMTRSNDYTGVDTQTGTGTLASVAKTIKFADSDGNGHITVGEAIAQINAEASNTKVKAELKDGVFRLVQIDDLNADDASKYNTVGGANTAGEGDTINYTLSGTGDFAYVTGFGDYSTPAQTSTGSMSSQSKSYLTGSTTVTGNETLAAGTFKVTGLTIDNTAITKDITVTAGETLSSVLTKITNSGAGVTASINADGKVIITSNYFTSLSLSTSGNTDFLRVAGYGQFKYGKATSYSGKGTDDGTHWHGYTKSTALLDGAATNGSLTINGTSITVIGKTAAQIVAQINASTVARAALQDDDADGVADDLVIQITAEGIAADNATKGIIATGDAARVLGLTDYSTTDGTAVAAKGTAATTHKHSYVTSTVAGPAGTVKSGTLKIEGTEITVLGKTVAEIVANINATTVARASLVGTTLTIQETAAYSADNKTISVEATGDAARALGLADYSNSKGTITAGAYENTYTYTYDKWTQKTDDWDLTKDYATADTYTSTTDSQGGVQFKYYDTTWSTTKYTGWTASKNTAYASDTVNYRSVGYNTQYREKYTEYQETYQTTTGWLDSTTPTKGGSMEYTQWREKYTTYTGWGDTSTKAHNGTMQTQWKEDWTETSYTGWGNTSTAAHSGTMETEWREKYNAYTDWGATTTAAHGGTMETTTRGSTTTTTKYTSWGSTNSASHGGTMETTTGTGTVSLIDRMEDLEWMLNDRDFLMSLCNAVGADWGNGENIEADGNVVIRGASYEGAGSIAMEMIISYWNQCIDSHRDAGDTTKANNFQPGNMCAKMAELCGGESGMSHYYTYEDGVLTIDLYEAKYDYIYCAENSDYYKTAFVSTTTTTKYREKYTETIDNRYNEYREKYTAYTSWGATSTATKGGTMETHWREKYSVAKSTGWQSTCSTATNGGTLSTRWREKYTAYTSWGGTSTATNGGTMQTQWKEKYTTTTAWSYAAAAATASHGGTVASTTRYTAWQDTAMTASRGGTIVNQYRTYYQQRSILDTFSTINLYSGTRTTDLSKDSTNATIAGYGYDTTRINVKAGDAKTSISRTWYKEWYFTKDTEDTAYSITRNGYWDGTCDLVNNATTQYRDIKITGYSYNTTVTKTYSGKITSGASNTSSLGSAFIGQVGGTITVKSNYYGTVGTVTYTATDSAQAILDKLAALKKDLDGITDGTAGNKVNNTKIFSSVSASELKTNAIYGSVSLSDSGNALKLLGFDTTNGASRSSTKSGNKFNTDYNAWGHGSAKFTGTAKIESTGDNFAAQTAGTLTIKIQNSADATKNQATLTVAYTATDTISSIISKINNLTYTFNTGKKVSNANGIGANDDYNFQKQSEGANAGWVHTDGSICYTAKLQASLNTDKQLVISADVYNTTDHKIVISDTGNFAKLAGLTAGTWDSDAGRTNNKNTDYNGITMKTATLTGSVGGLTLDSIRPFQTSTDGKSDVAGDKTFQVKVGSVVAGTVTYNSTSTIEDIIAQINDFTYDYNSNKVVTTPFTDGTAVNDDNSWHENSEGEQVGYVDGDGKIHYTAKLQCKLENGKIVITSDVYDTANAQAITVANDTGSFTKLVGLVGTASNVTTSSTSVKGDEGVYTYTGAKIEGMKGDSVLTFTEGQFTVTIDDISTTVRTDGTDTVNLKEIKYNVTVGGDDSVQDVLDKIVSQGKAQIAEKYGVAENTIHLEATVSGNKIVIKMDGKYGENITFTNDTSKFIQRTGLSTSEHTYADGHSSTKESTGYDRITGSVNTITKSLVIGNLTTETFTISGGNGTYNVTIQNGWTVEKIIEEISTQTEGHYKAGIYNDAIFESDHQQAVGNYDNAAKGMFYIESTVQTATNTSVTSTDFTRRMGLVNSNVNLDHGPDEETFKGDHGYFNYYSNAIKGLRPNSIISGIKDGKLTFTLHALEATGQTGSIEYRADHTYTIDIAYNDTVTSVLNKMKQAILKDEDDTLEHSDVTDTNRIDRLDFHVDYDAATDSGKISLQLIGNYASGITFDEDTSGFMQSLGLDQKQHTYEDSYGSTNLSSGKSMLTGSVTNITESKIFGNMTAGTLTISAGSDTTKTINIAATDRAIDIINKINEGGIFTASLDAQGRFVIKTNNQNANAITLSGTSDFYKIAGLKAGSWSYSTSDTTGHEDYTKLTSSVYGLSADQTFNNMTTGKFYIKADGLTTVTVNVTKGSTTVANVLSQINASTDFAATLDDTGRIVISTKKCVGSSIVIDSGTTNYASVVGLKSGTLDGNAIYNAGVKDEFSTLKGSVTGVDSGVRPSAGDFTISVEAPDGSTKSQTFTLTGNESIADVLATISASDLNISAVLDASNNSIVLKSKTAGAYKISLKDGTSNFAETAGFTKNGAQASATTIGSLSTLTSTNTAAAAQALGFSTGDFNIALINTDGSIKDSRSILINANDTVDSIISKINQCGLGLSAAINADGKLVVQRDANTSAGGISITKGTSDFTNKIGFTSGGNLSASTSFSAGTDATRSVLKSFSLSASAASDTLGSLGITTGNFKINGISISVKETDSIASLLNKINSTFAGNQLNGVYAEYSGSKITLTSNSASENSLINIEAGSSNITDVLGFTNASNLTNSAQDVGLNAKFSLNGVNYETNSNIISLTDSGDITTRDAADEVIRFTLKNTGSGTVDIGKKALTDAASKLATFVSSFNSTSNLSQINYLIADPEFQALQGAIKNSLYNNVGNYKQVSKELASMGITIYSTKTANSENEKIAISLNREKFINAYLNDPQKVMDILVGNDSKPLDVSKAGAFTRLADTLQNSAASYFSSNINSLQARAKDIALQIAQNTADLNNITASLSLGDAQSSFDDMTDYLTQLQQQYDSVNSLIKKMRNNYNQSVTRLALNPV